MSEEPPSPGTEIAVVVQDSTWRETLQEATEIARRAAGAVLRRQDGVTAGAARPSSVQTGCPMAAAELTVVLADDLLVRRLNRQYRGQDRATNVLSFVGLDGPPEVRPETPQLLGDVVLARETIFREAREQDKSPGDHLSHLVVHGVLHLLGFDHETEAQADLMETVERAVLAGLGVADPYRAPPTHGPCGGRAETGHD